MHAKCSQLWHVQHCIISSLSLSEHMEQVAWTKLLSICEISISVSFLFSFNEGFSAALASKSDCLFPYFESRFICMRETAIFFFNSKYVFHNV